MDLEELKGRGVKILGEAVEISDDCVVEAGAEIYAPAHISGASHIHGGARIMPYCFLEGADVGGGTTVFSSTLIKAHIGENCTVGPYAYLRGGANIGNNCRIGDFVEVKSSTLGDGTKAAHLAYIGDADVGKGVNIGCGVVFCNYDGQKKRKSVVEDGAFIGANCNIVAPVLIKRGAYIAAGTTLTCDLESGDFCIGRSREKVMRGGAVGRFKGV